MKKAPKIQDAERSEISILLKKGYSARGIAEALGRSPNTIAEEIRRNLVVGVYDPLKAKHKAYVRRKYAKYQGMKIRENKQLEHYIVEGLKQHWNPDEISGRMKDEHQPFYASKTAIYDWLYSAWGQVYCQHLASRRYHPKPRKPNKTERVMIPDRVSISRRPLGATNRTRYGGWEGDTIVSGKRTGSVAALVVLSERKSRYLDAQIIPNLSPLSFNQAVGLMRSDITKMTSLSLDNGIENRYHAELNMPTFFCDPYSSWQKGGVENGNRMIRRYIKKGSNLSDYTQPEIDEIIARINNKPRKILGYKTARELALKKGVITRETVLIEG